MARTNRGCGATVWALMTVAVLAIGCGEGEQVRGVEVTEQNRDALYEQVRSGRALTGDEVRLLDAFVARRGEGGLPVGWTIEEMIADQRRVERGAARADAGGAPATAEADAGVGGEAAAGGAEEPVAAPSVGAAPTITRPVAPPPVAVTTMAPRTAGTAATAPPTTAAPAPTPRTLVVASGTRLEIVLEHPLSSRSSQAGDAFSATLASDLVSGGKLVAPQGSRLTGEVLQAQASGKVKGRAQMALALQTLEVGGRSYDVVANTLRFEARATKGDDAKKVGIGAGAGAIIGAIAGGKKGAAIGAAAGAAAGGGVVLLTAGDEVELGAEQHLQFELESDLTVAND